VILLDTHAALWLRAGDAKLGPVARAEIERAWQAEEVAMSAMSFWEMAMLREKGRIEYPDDVSRWRLEQLGQGLIEIPVDGEIGIRASALADFHADPADRIIVATAMNGHQLVTADRRNLDWSGRLRCVDAARSTSRR
jgi:PIN domain nuclease of toxin-antitoxin system